MFSKHPSFILGFHGCDQKTGEAILAGNSELQSSENAHDWLGHGVYFWENNPTRALQWAVERKENPFLGRTSVAQPFVVGAIIDLGNCLDFLDAQSFPLLDLAYNTLVSSCKKKDVEIPQNSGGKDLFKRELDCAVIQTLHSVCKAKSIKFDSVRGLFSEGKPVYPGSRIHRKDHIQICIRNRKSIKGYFRVKDTTGLH